MQIHPLRVAIAFTKRILGVKATTQSSEGCPASQDSPVPDVRNGNIPKLGASTQVDIITVHALRNDVGPSAVLVKSLGEIANKAKTLEEDLGVATAENNSLRQLLESCKQELQAARSEVAAMKNSTEELKQDLHHALQELSHERSEREYVEDKVEEQKRQIQLLCGQINQLRASALHALKEAGNKDYERHVAQKCLKEEREERIRLANVLARARLRNAGGLGAHTGRWRKERRAVPRIELTRQFDDEDIYTQYNVVVDSRKQDALWDTDGDGLLWPHWRFSAAARTVVEDDLKSCHPLAVNLW